MKRFLQTILSDTGWWSWMAIVFILCVIFFTKRDPWFIAGYWVTAPLWYYLFNYQGK